MAHAPSSPDRVPRAAPSREAAGKTKHEPRASLNSDLPWDEELADLHAQMVQARQIRTARHHHGEAPRQQWLGPQWQSEPASDMLHHADVLGRLLALQEAGAWTASTAPPIVSQYHHRGSVGGEPDRGAYLIFDDGVPPATELAHLREPTLRHTASLARLRADRAAGHQQAHAPRQTPHRAGHADRTAARIVLLREMRRVWMGPSKRAPQTLLIAAIPSDPAHRPGRWDETEVSGAHRALHKALSLVGTPHPLDLHTVAALLPRRTARETIRVAEAMRMAFDVRLAKRGQPPRRLAVAVASLHRDDDPVRTLCVAERGLRLALSVEASRVICEGDFFERPSRSSQRMGGY